MSCSLFRIYSFTLGTSNRYYVSSAEALVNDNSVAVEAAVFLWKDSLRSQLITDGEPV